LELLFLALSFIATSLLQGSGKNPLWIIVFFFALVPFPFNCYLYALVGSAIGGSLGYRSDSKHFSPIVFPGFTYSPLAWLLFRLGIITSVATLAVDKHLGFTLFGLSFSHVTVSVVVPIACWIFGFTLDAIVGRRWISPFISARPFTTRLAVTGVVLGLLSHVSAIIVDGMSYGLAIQSPFVWYFRSNYINSFSLSLIQHAVVGGIIGGMTGYAFDHSAFPRRLLSGSQLVRS
jgi:hypothetical protein